MSADTGGPAFPIPHGAHVDGMSLRDWFAGQALARLTLSLSPLAWQLQDAGEAAYLYADAMIAARVKR